MSGERALLNTVFGRAVVVVLVALLALIPAPAAMATPESDAADAINQAYEASGGVAGPMGPSDGGVYPIGGGFGQNYAGGKIFFTPATGAHLMGGAILQKYESLGGPADGDLGFPTIDEGPGKVSPESRNSTFSAADKPVIFWTPETGAHVVRGAINAAWDKLGGSAGPLGVPTEDEVFNGAVVSQKFTGGELSWNRMTKEFTTVPPDLAGQLGGLNIPGDATSAIAAARRAAGGPLGPLGAKQGPQYPIGQDGAGQDFAGGKIFYSPATGANVVSGQVLAKYESVGGPQGDLGLPTSNETDGSRPGSRISTFSAEDEPVIFWTPDYGAFIVRGAMNAAWSKLGGATGDLGPPVADQTEDGNVVTQRFADGEISWDKQTNKFATEPAGLASDLAGLSVPGYEPPPVSNTTAPSSDGRKWYSPSWWWLLAGIPLLVLVGLILVATLRNRGGDVNPLDGDGDGDGDGDDDDDFDFDTAHDTAAEAEAVRLAGSDVVGTARLAESYRRPADSTGYGSSGLGQSPFAAPGDDSDEFSELEPEPDESDTAPTPIQTEDDANSGRHAAIQLDESSEDLHHAAAAPTVGPESNGMPEPQTTIHLALEDPYLAPSGYPVKADTKSGLYWAPESDLYDDVPADVYFVSEEFARANGFVKAE